MEKTLEYYMNLPYSIEIIPEKDGSGYTLLYTALKGCITCANTIAEGIELLNDAKKCWISACLEDGIEIPEP